jgi:hypothetical protein
MRDAVFQARRRLVVGHSADYPCSGLVAPFVEVVEMERHFRVVGLWRAYGIVGLAVLAEYAGVGVGREVRVLLRVAWCDSV